MNKDQIKQIRKAIDDWMVQTMSEGGLIPTPVYDAIHIIDAALAEPSEPVAWMWKVKPDSPIMRIKGEKCGAYFEDPKTIGIDIDSEDQKQNYEWSLLYTQPSKPEPLTDEEIRTEFGKLYPNDIGILELAENNRDFAMEAIGARHHWTAFLAGARAIEAAVWEKLK